MKSKICWSLLIIILLFNFIYTNYFWVYADEDNENITYSEEEYEDLADSGSTSLGTVSSSTSAAAGATTMITSIGSVILSPLALISVFVNNGGIYRTESDYSAEKVVWFNLESLVFDEYLVFNIDVTKTASSLNSNIAATSTTSWIDTLKDFVRGAYRITSRVSIVLFFIVLVYTFIRLMTSETAQDRAKFRKVGRIWLKAIIFMILVITIVAVFSVVNEWLMDMLYDIRLTMEDAGYASFETSLFKECREGYLNYGGFKAAMFFIELVLFVIIDIMFLGKYLKRSAMIFLLIVIAPVYAVISVFKQLNDDKGVISMWFYQYASNVFIQPFHAVMYLTFMVTISNIAVNSPLVGLLLLYSLLLAERIGQVILNFSRETVGSLLQKDN